MQKNTSFNVNSSDNSPDTANIFTTETLTVSAEVRELIDSFTVTVQKNRFWTTKTVRHPTSEDYRFFISFYDIGNQTITIKTSRSNGADPYSETILLNVKNPLHQNNIPPYNISDSIILSCGANVDKDGPALYNWLFGKDGVHIQSSNPTIKTTISSDATLQTQGFVWVSDPNFESPRVPFTYNFYDSTPPVIICVNDNYNIQNKTIATSDTIFSFMVRVTDRGNQGVDSVTIDGGSATPAFKGRLNIYTSVITNMHIHTQANPLKIMVKAIDNKQYRNDTTEYFNIIFDEKATHHGSTILKINSITDSSLSTSRNNFNVFGSVENTQQQRILLNLFLGNVHLKDTLIKGYGNWSSVLSLKDGANLFYILAKDSNEVTVDSQAVMIFYQPNAVDNVPPVILSKEIDGQTVDNETYFTKNDSVTIQISTFDAGSGVQKIKYDDDSIMVQESNFRPSFVIHGLRHERRAIPLQVIDFKGNLCNDTLNIFQNTRPAYTLTHHIPFVVFIDSTYTDTINFSDNDLDSVFLQILSKPNSMTIDTSSGIFGIISWTPKAQDTNGLSFQLQDRLDDPTISEFYKFAVMDSKNMSPNLEISNETSVPSFLQADSDTLLSVIKIKAGTGKRPFLFTADLVKKSISLLNRSSDSQIVWIPKESDTGTVELRIIVEDSLRFCDTLFRSIAIVPKNNYKSTLSWSTTLDTTGGRLILGGESDTVLLHFLIHDADDPRTEKHIITQKSRGQVLTMQVNTDTFTLKLTPKSNLTTDTLHVIINDNTGASDTISIRLIYSTYPDHIPQLYSWFNDNTYRYLKDDLPNKIDDWGGIGTNPFPFDNSNGDCDLFVHTTTDGHKAIKFNDKNNFLINLTQGNLFDSSLTVFIVAKYDSIPAGSENMTLISSNELSNYSNNSTGFGVSKEGFVCFFSRTAATSTITEKTSSNIIVAPRKWHVFSFSTPGIDGHTIAADISVDRVHDNLSAIGHSDPGLIVGRCSKNTPLFPWCGDIAEIIIFNRVLSFDERTSIELYLADKFVP